MYRCIVRVRMANIYACIVVSFANLTTIALTSMEQSGHYVETIVHRVEPRELLGSVTL